MSGRQWSGAWSKRQPCPAEPPRAAPRSPARRSEAARFLERKRDPRSVGHQGTGARQLAGPSWHDSRRMRPIDLRTASSRIRRTRRPNLAKSMGAGSARVLATVLPASRPSVSRVETMDRLGPAAGEGRCRWRREFRASRPRRRKTSPATLPTGTPRHRSEAQVPATTAETSSRARGLARIVPVHEAGILRRSERRQTVCLPRRPGMRRAGCRTAIARHRHP